MLQSLIKRRESDDYEEFKIDFFFDNDLIYDVKDK